MIRKYVREAGLPLLDPKTVGFTWTCEEPVSRPLDLEMIMVNGKILSEASTDHPQVVGRVLAQERTGTSLFY
jgi:hypothetical protein